MKTNVTPVRLSLKIKVTDMKMPGKTLSIILAVLLIHSCGKKDKNSRSVAIIGTPAEQQSIFNKLLTVSNNSIPAEQLPDSLAFLVLPVQASCPSCRKKTIDSIAAHQNDLLANHFIIISANGGRKTINSFFREVNKELPDMGNKLFLDSANNGYKYDLFKDKPTMYYTYQKKAYKKVESIPMTVREDLREFFSG